jgi:hypothetical protein
VHLLVYDNKWIFKMHGAKIKKEKQVHIVYVRHDYQSNQHLSWGNSSDTTYVIKQVLLALTLATYVSYDSS